MSIITFGNIVVVSLLVRESNGDAMRRSKEIADLDDLRPQGRPSDLAATAQAA
jgi:hypothetical protein